MEFTETDKQYMGLALAEAEKALIAGEVAVGCAIVKDGAVLVCAHNKVQETGDLTAHAECLAIRSLPRYALMGATLYVTLEPCPMCAGAIVLSRIPVVVYGLSDPKRGGQSVFGILDHPNLIHRARLVPGILEDECHAQITRFFQERRAGLLGKPERT